MNNEQLLQMYKALSENPGELVRAAARKRLINFARYMQPDLVLEPFHVVYYTPVSYTHLDVYKRQFPSVLLNEISKGYKHTRRNKKARKSKNCRK